MAGNEKKGSGLVGLDVFRSILRPAYVTARSNSGPFFFAWSGDVRMKPGKYPFNGQGSDKKGFSLRIPPVVQYPRTQRVSASKIRHSRLDVGSVVKHKVARCG